MSSKNSDSSGVVLFGGWVLYEALLREAKNKGDDDTALCNAIAVTKGYFSMIGAGTRHADTLSDDFFRACSSYLEIPYLLVQIIAGRISHEDIVVVGNYAGIDMGNILKTARDFTLVKT